MRMALGVTYTFWRQHKKDWDTWIDLINHNYSVQFYNGQTEQVENAINKIAVFYYQERKTDRGSSAVIKVGHLTVNCHFFSGPQIENDIDPREITIPEEHDKLISYLKAISKRLRKPVYVTAENQPSLIYITVEGNKVNINVE